MDAPGLQYEVEIGARGGVLPGTLGLPERARGLVVFAHGSGSSRLSARNVAVASRLVRAGLATLLFDLLTEREAADRAKVFDIGLLASRLADAVAWARGDSHLRELPMGLFGASTGAAAALTAAAHDPSIGAVVSRGGRPDLAMAHLGKVKAPTLVVVGSLDREVLELNQAALARLAGPSRMEVVPGAGHLFEEPGALSRVAEVAAAWFGEHLGRASEDRHAPYRDRVDAGRALAQQVAHLREQSPVVVALPRGGVVVGAEVADALEAPLDMLLVRKLRAPRQPELAIGAVVDVRAQCGPDTPSEVLVSPLARRIGVTREQLDAEVAAQLGEIARQEREYRRGRAAVPLRGRAVIVVDDGVATGASTRAALVALRRCEAARVVLAVPVGPPGALAAMRAEADEVVCPLTPEVFRAVGEFYDRFDQTTDAEVVELLGRAARRERVAAT